MSRCLLPRGQVRAAPLPGRAPGGRDGVPAAAEGAPDAHARVRRAVVLRPRVFGERGGWSAYGRVKT